jgi:pyridoxal phosphate enzyme (YggS family)
MKKCKMIESLDSWRLAKEINKRAQKNKRIMPVLVEVNVSGEENKFGIKPKNTVEFVKKISNLSYINIEGLMTLAPYVKDSEETRPYFKMLAQLRDEINSQGYDLKELSMGMSDDFEVAIEEGATIVRIGTALFGNRNY